ncbi:Hypothetical protein CINCED_3A007315 [Cinara cedri]|uniref:Uncharacterized protein n=1 Tax=Cinara cedri TaxID=506608 RepID=A0A5E4NJ57_9HEMI|nr:Hypothetical protein CINCED_3A007315 [Cinara cedri]
MKHISLAAVVYVVIFGLSSFNFLDCHLQDITFRNNLRIQAEFMKRAMCTMDVRYYIGKKFWPNYLYTPDRTKRNMRTHRGIYNYEEAPYNSNIYRRSHWSYYQY